MKPTILSRFRTLGMWLLATGFAAGAQAQLSAAGTLAVPTYESVGLYWTNPGGTAGCEVRFRKSSESAWRDGLPMWYDARDSQCRGSLVSLDPNTSYDVQMNLPGQAASRALTFRTWSNNLPVAKTIIVNSGAGTFNVAEGGSAAGYVVYQGAPGAVLDAANAAQFNVSINASYVIVRGLTLKGAQQDAIRISPSVKDVVIEDNDISGWGRTRDGKWGADMDSGIRAICSQPTLERVTIQRNRIHDPRYGANSWTDGHPAGPQAITISYCGGNHVIRHNDMYSNNGNFFNDVIGGEDNFTKSGFPNADTDIYANRVANGWDDGIEAEGANENVRIWGNYIDRTAIGIATTVTSVGPLYIFRNVYNRSNYLQSALGNPDADDRQVFFKSGSDASLGNGRRYVLHNTMLQMTQAGATYPLGAGAGIGGTGSTQLVNNTVSKNNIYHLWKAKGVAYQFGSGNEFASDLYNGTAGEAVYASPIVGTPVYAAGNGPANEGQYQLAAASPGYGRGARLANFNDTVGAPDVGAHQSGSGAFAFGVAASPGSAISGSANTITNTAPVPYTPASPTTPTTKVGTGVTLSSSALDFSSVATQSVTYTNNTGVRVTFIQAQISSARFSQSNNCSDVEPGASCTAAVTYFPGNSGSSMGTFTVTSTSPDSPHVVSLSAGGNGVGFSTAAAQTLITHFYRSILRREPDGGGSAFWLGEATRVVGLGADLNETWYAMAMAFLSSAEYSALRRDDAGFATDLYATFANRAPDGGGLAYWTGQLAAGMPREVLTATFMFSGEFSTYTRGLFGPTQARAEINVVMDLYRGLLARLPDSAGFAYAVQRLRAAQCSGAGAVQSEVEALAGSFMENAEYAGRRRNSAQFIGDLYNATLRRGGDLQGAQFWISQLDSGQLSGRTARGSFIASAEFSARVAAIVAQGCIR